jgi:hypothetical protein
VCVTPDGVGVLASEDKWIKAKALLEEGQDMLDEDSTSMSKLRLEQIQGFLIYVTRTYPCMVPYYLIGFHMTIDSWRPNQREDGWRFSMSELKFQAQAMEEDGEAMDASGYPEAPVCVIDALRTLMSSEKPLLRQVRCKKSLKVYYGFSDASGYAFGGSIQVADNIWYEYGQWSTQISEENSSNWRELANLVNVIERSVIQHGLAGPELFVFTDNQTAESAFWKGHSSSPKLFELILRLRKLEMTHGILLHVIHVSGKRMISQGTDGL